MLESGREQSELQNRSKVSTGQHIMELLRKKSFIKIFQKKNGQIFRNTFFQLLLWCMRLGKNVIRIDPHREKILATILLWYRKPLQKNGGIMEGGKKMFWA